MLDDFAIDTPTTTAIVTLIDPRFATIQLAYKGSGVDQDSFSFNWFTTATQAEVRSSAKDAIRQDIIDKLGVAIPKANIKMLNSPE